MKSYYKLFIFLIYPLIYFLLGYLNAAYWGKFSLMGLLLLGSFLYLYFYKPNRITKTLFIAISVIFFIHMAFYATLRDIFHMTQDDLVVMNSIFSTSAQESKEFLIQYKWYLIKHIIIAILFILSYFYFTLKVPLKNKIKKKSLLIIITLLLIIHLNPIRRANPLYYYPYYYLKWEKNIQLINSLKNRFSKNSSKLNSVKYVGPNKNTVVWIIGESSTRVNWSLYGYKRDTTPKLNSIKNQLLVVKNAKAAGPITIPSLENMLTSATLKNPNAWKNNPSIIQYAKKAGYKTFWITNHPTDKNGIINAFASSADFFLLTNRGTARGEGSFDNTLLKPFKKALANNAKRKLIILHMVESHPAYNYRYPKEYSKFTTVFNDTVMKKLKKEGRALWALVFRNTYDNSILYSDTIKYRIIQILKHSKEANNSILLYLSDHGEDVCHNTNFSGHNPKAKEQWEIPFILWPKSKAKNYLDANKSFEADKLDLLLLKLLKIKN